MDAAACLTATSGGSRPYDRIASAAFDRGPAAVLLSPARVEVRGGGRLDQI